MYNVRKELLILRSGGPRTVEVGWVGVDAEMGCVHVAVERSRVEG